MHILFTRPLEDCEELILKFSKFGHKVSHMPVIQIEKIECNISPASVDVLKANWNTRLYTKWMFRRDLF